MKPSYYSFREFTLTQKIFTVGIFLIPVIFGSTACWYYHDNGLLAHWAQILMITFVPVMVWLFLYMLIPELVPQNPNTTNENTSSPSDSIPDLPLVPMSSINAFSRSLAHELLMRNLTRLQSEAADGKVWLWSLRSLGDTAVLLDYPDIVQSVRDLLRQATLADLVRQHNPFPIGCPPPIDDEALERYTTLSSIEFVRSLHRTYEGAVEYLKGISTGDKYLELANQGKYDEAVAISKSHGQCYEIAAIHAIHSVHEAFERFQSEEHYAYRDTGVRMVMVIEFARLNITEKARLVLDAMDEKEMYPWDNIDVARGLCGYEPWSIYPLFDDPMQIFPFDEYPR